MKTIIPSAMQPFIDELAECETSTEKFQFFIDLADEIPLLPADERTEESKILGCASNAWVAIQKNGEIFEMKGDAEAIISKGFLAFFLLGFAESSREEILSFTVNELEEFGIISSLSPSRSNGALSSLNKIHSLVNAL